VSSYEISYEKFLEVAKEAMHIELTEREIGNLEVSIRNMHSERGFGGEQNALALAKMLILSVFHYRERKKTS
jgi:hypothetical protein